MKKESDGTLKGEEVVVRTRRGPSVVWLIPIIALMIGGWLGYKAISERGILITIRFDSAAGLEAGKTKIRYRDVDVGKVEDVRLSEDLEGVLVSARIDKRAAPFLNETTKLWVVRARLSTNEISGLGTLFSGAYIAIAASEGEEKLTHFRGLESPPILTGDLPGRHFILKAEELGSLDVGAPVYYRQIQVGKVVGYSLDQENDHLDIRIFVDAPHHKRVYEGTRFWAAEGLDVSFGPTGVKLDTQSLVSILSGGIAFENPPDMISGELAAENAAFRLFPNHDSTFEKDFLTKKRMIMHFESSVRGLVPGAPVEFKGMRVGKVLSVNLELDARGMDYRIPVVVEVEPDRIKLLGVEKGEGDVIDWLLSEGLKARLEVSSLLTGQLLVNLDIYPDSRGMVPRRNGSFIEVPTLPTTFEELTGSVSGVLKKLEKVPFENIGRSLDKSLQSFDEAMVEFRETAANFRGDISPTAVSSLEEFRQTLTELQKNFGSDSRLSYTARQTLEELGKSARSMRTLTDYLDRHPEALLLGKKEDLP